MTINEYQNQIRQLMKRLRTQKQMTNDSTNC